MLDTLELITTMSVIKSIQRLIQTGEIKMTLATINTSIVSPISDLRETPMTERFKISVEVYGIKRRCRKNERHFFQVSSIPYNDGKYDGSAINDLVKDFLDSNMKWVSSQVVVHLDHVKVSNERGFTSTLWEPFSSLNVRYKFNS
jgi:hypothetical protein